MRCSLQEKETIIVFNEKDDTAQVYTCNDKLKTKLKNFEKTSNECTRLKERDDKQSKTYIIPKSWVEISQPEQCIEEKPKSKGKSKKTSKKIATKATKKENNKNE